MSFLSALKKPVEEKPAAAPKPVAEPVVAKKSAAPVAAAAAPAAAAPKAEKKKAEKKPVEEAAPKAAEEPVSLPLKIVVAEGKSSFADLARKPAAAKPAAPVPEKVEKKKAESEDRHTEKIEKVAAAPKAEESEVKANKPRREAGERKKNEKKAEKKSEDKPVEEPVPEVSKPLEIAAVSAAGAWGSKPILAVIAAKSVEVAAAPTPAPKKSKKGAAQKEAAPVAAVAPEVAAPKVEVAAPVVEETPVAAPVEESKSSEAADDASLEIEGGAEAVEIDVEARALPETPLSEAEVPPTVLEPLHKEGDARAETPVAPVVPVSVSPVKLSTEQDQQLQKGTTVVLPVGHQKSVQPAGTFTFIGVLPAEPVAPAAPEPVRAPVRATAVPVSSTPVHHQSAVPHYNTTHNNVANTYQPAHQPPHQSNQYPASTAPFHRGPVYFDEPHPHPRPAPNSYNNSGNAGGYQGHNNAHVSSVGRGGGYRGNNYDSVPRGGYDAPPRTYDGHGRGRGGYDYSRGGMGSAPRGYNNDNSGYYPPNVQNNAYGGAPINHHDAPAHNQYSSNPSGGYNPRYNNPNSMAPPTHHATNYRGTSYPMPPVSSYTRGRGRGAAGQSDSAIMAPGLFSQQQYNNSQPQDYHHQQQYGGHQQRAPHYSSAPPPSSGQYGNSQY